MSVLEHPQERAWAQGVSSTVAAVGAMNLAVARLVGTIRMLLDTNGWHGGGIQSIEHWVCWHAAMAPRRSHELVRIARRIHELPGCWALFETGRLSEDAMVRIARRVPAARDTEVAAWAPGMLISQLTRALASCPDLPEGDPKPTPERQRYVRLQTRRDGWGQGELSLPPDEMAQLQVALQAARDAEYRDRTGLDPDAEIPAGAARGSITTADAFMRLTQEGLDGLDTDLARTGRRGERTKVILHFDVDPSGELGPGQLHLGPVLPDSLARFLACDAEIILAAYQAGQLIGINPTDRTVNRHQRRALEHRDQGCAHPLCTQRRWLHIHHIIHWHHRGLTVPANLVCLCPTHHRQIHTGELRIEGNPETASLRFYDTRGRPIEPPAHGSTGPPPPDEPTPYTPPFGEHLDPRWFGWN